MKSWLYRVLDTDDDGDPLDFGVVNADTLDTAVRLVTEHLAEILEPEEDMSLPVRFYTVLSQAAGVWTTSDFEDLTILVKGVQ